MKHSGVFHDINCERRESKRNPFMSISMIYW